MEDVTGDGCTVSLLRTRAAGEGLYVMTSNSIFSRPCTVPMQADLRGFTCQVLQMRVMGRLPKQTSSPGARPRFRSPLSIAGRKEGNL